MNRATSVFLGTLVLIVIGAGGVWRGLMVRPATDKPHQDSPTPATARKTPESEMGLVTLSAKSEERLGLTTAARDAKARDVATRLRGRSNRSRRNALFRWQPRWREYCAAPSGGPPFAGQKVEKGDHLFDLVPILSQDARTNFAAAKEDAEGQVNNARTQLEMSKLALVRAERLYKAEAGSKERTVEEAKAQHDTVLRLMEATQSRLQILDKALDDANTGPRRTDFHHRAGKWRPAKCDRTFGPASSDRSGDL